MRKVEVNTGKLTGAALDWAVAKCEGVCTAPEYWHLHSYSTDWSQGGPIIERERITVATRHDGWWRAWLCDINDEATAYMIGGTPLEAAMRCYVASKLGDSIVIPVELLPV